jgi:SAM-dependent methyltransferase
MPVRSIRSGAFLFPPEVAAYMKAQKGIDAFEARFKAYPIAVEQEFETLSEWLPDACESFMDIGCGLGLVDVLIARATGAKTIFMMDGDGSVMPKMGFKSGTRAWGNVRMGQMLVQKNLPTSVKVATLTPDPTHRLSVDLIVSLKSWGHHYPVETYLDLAKASLSEGGVLILDLRRGRGGRETLEKAGFCHLDTVFENPKRQRMVFAR